MGALDVIYGFGLAVTSEVINEAILLGRRGPNLAGSIQGSSLEQAFEVRKKSKAVSAATQSPAETATAPNPIASSSKPNVNGARA